ncbi:MAG: glycosyltransferase family 1 protein [Actinomycetota bacterium]|nr:glycosyltransferase family 1 protein [Actinomycetota bacterium]
MTGSILRIGIDISTLLNHGPDIGAGRYIINLIRSLLRIDKENTYVLTGRYITSEYLPEIYDLKSQFPDSKMKLDLYNTTSRKLKSWDKIRFPLLELRGFKADILHCPDYLIPPTMNKNIILTVHDLAFIRFPEFNFDWFIKKYTEEIKRNARISKKIIADSDSTRNDIVNFLGIDPDRVEVVYLAADDIFRKLTETEKSTEVLKKYQLDKKYILSVGTIEPRKNFAALIRAFNNIKKSKTGSGYKLVIVGRTGWKSEATYQERENSPYGDDILFTGRITDRDLVQLYNWAELFVYPSLFEGFGLPPLEAMSCGLPVIAYGTSSLKEIIGDAGKLVETGDETKLENQLLYVLENEKIKRELSSKSLIQAKKFSWEETAKKTLDIYNKIIL